MGFRAGGIAIKARKALADKFSWSSSSSISPASPSVSAEVARLREEMEEMGKREVEHQAHIDALQERVGAVSQAADGAVVAELQNKLRDIDRLEKRVDKLDKSDETTVGGS